MSQWWPKSLPPYGVTRPQWVNPSHTEIILGNIKIYFLTPQTLTHLRPRQNGRHFTDDSFKCIFLNENFQISNKISLKFVLKGPINNIPSLVQIMAWRQPGGKPLSKLMMVRSVTHELSHRGRVTHTCISKLVPHWFRCPGAYSAPSHYLN